MCLDVIGQSKQAKTYNEPTTGIQTRNQDKRPEEVWALQREWLLENVALAEEKHLVVNLSAVSLADFDEFIELCGVLDTKLIVLDRKSVLLTALSALRARAYAETLQSEGKRPQYKIDAGQTVDILPSVSATALRQAISLVFDGQARCERLQKAIPFVKYYYEDIETDIDGVLTDLLWQIGIGWFPFSIRHGKFSPSNLRQSVANADEVESIAREMGAM